MIVLLCEWAITCERTGSHRASVSAKLIEMRQTTLAAAAVRPAQIQAPSPSTLNAASANSSTEAAPVTTGDGASANGGEGGLDESMNGVPPLADGDGSPMETETPPLFQQLLLGFLDTKAPALGL